MSTVENIERVITALKRVPAKPLLIIELANTIPLVNGQPDLEVLRAKRKEINLAEVEAKAYGGATISAVSSLSRCRSIDEG